MQELGIFAKYWKPGQVKTRLAATVGNEFASRIYRQFLTTLVERFQDSGDRRTLVFTPESERATFETLVASYNWQCICQQGRDLVERMSHYFEERFQAGAKAIVLIGSDSPTLPQEIMTQAFLALQTHDLVLGPSTDGGYYLIGMRHPHPELFRDINWSSAQVWSQTMERIEELAGKVSLAVLPEWYDVDTQQDLTRLFHELQSISDDSPAISALFACCAEIIHGCNSDLSNGEV